MPQPFQLFIEQLAAPNHRAEPPQGEPRAVPDMACSATSTARNIAKCRAARGESHAA